MKLGLLCACVALLASLAAPARATNLFGETGLVFIPTADVTQRGDYTIGINSVSLRYRQYSPSLTEPTVVHYFQLGLMPRVELTVGVTNLDGKLFATYHDPVTDPISHNSKGAVGGWDIDKLASVRVLLMPQHGIWPALAIGARDPIGTGYFGAGYLVATRRFEASGRPDAGLGLHLGFGRHIKERPTPMPLDGVFGGVDYWPHPRLGLMLETTQDSMNFGARIRLTKHFELQPALMGMNQLAGGVAFSSRM